MRGKLNYYCPVCEAVFERHMVLGRQGNAVCTQCFKRTGVIPKRWDVVNFVAKAIGAETYLEIGLGTLDCDGRSFEGISVPHKESVDPEQVDATHVMTSDEFFATNTKQYDLVFVDGWHLQENVRRDIENSFKCGAKAVVVHDCDPAGENNQLRYPTSPDLWNGDVWKEWARLRATRPDFWMGVVDLSFEYGCGLILPGKQECIELPEVLDWAYFVVNRQEILNLMSWSEWAEEVKHVLCV